MWVLIPGLVLALAGLWPQTAFAIRIKPLRPPGITIHWTGPLPAIKWDSLSSNDDSSQTDQALVIIKFKEPGTYRVTFTAGAVAKAEAETQDGQALFMLTQGPFPLRHFSITATTSCLPDADPRGAFRGFMDLDGSISGRPFSTPYYPVPLAVELVIVPLQCQLLELPSGSLVRPDKRFQYKSTSIHRRFSLDLAAVGKSLHTRFLGIQGGDEYTTGPFSLAAPSSEPADPFAPHLFRWNKIRRLSKLLNDVQPLNGILYADQSLSTGTTNIQPVEWQKTRAAEYLDTKVCDECRVFVPNEENEPDVIIIRTYPEPKKPESDDPFRFLNGLTIGGVGITF
jgi:hypothetical protein